MRAAPHRLLMLDYDGTLAPLTADRLTAAPLPAALPPLRALATCTHTTLAVVSGRALDEIVALLGSIGATLVGEHGWDVRGRDGQVRREPMPAEVADALARGEHLAREAGAGSALERKRTALVLHTRAMPPHVARA
ncbi:MAG TPA: trehalose-phosphatase, partial [Candidatus Acidoferrales bacterium]|nr:trehalose-phosphatase [Candidatus Acidoferrales bacterium]